MSNRIDCGQEIEYREYSFNNIYIMQLNIKTKPLTLAHMTQSDKGDKLIEVKGLCENS